MFYSRFRRALWPEYELYNYALQRLDRQIAAAGRAVLETEGGAS